MSVNTYHLFLNGRMSDPAIFRAIYQPGDSLIAVDGGLNHLLALTLIPNVLIGDMDSISQTALDEQRKSGVTVIQYPVEKDETDFELALQYVYQKRPVQVNVFAGSGGRLDHTLTNLSLASSVRFSDPTITFWSDDGEMYFIHRSRQVDGSAGDTVSLIPWGGEAVGVTTLGMQYSLNNETLYPDRSRGISNVMLTETVEVRIKSGRLLCIHQRH